MPRKNRQKEWANTTASAADCTGLMPALPENAPEEAAYETLYPFVQPPILDPDAEDEEGLRK